MSLFIHQLKALTEEELLDLFRRRRSFVFIIMYIGCYVLSFQGLSKVQEESIRFLDQIGINGESGSNMMLQKINDLLPPLFFESHPLPLVLLQLMALSMLPTFTSFISSDMMCADFQRKTLRIIMLRGRRMPYYFSKLIAHFILFFSIHTLTLISLMIYFSFRLDDFSAVIYFWASLKYLFLFSIFLINTLALTQLISGLVKKSVTAILLLNVIWMVFLCTMAYPPFSPFCLEQIQGLIVPTSEYFMFSFSAQLIWASLFLGTGVFLFNKKEI